jgi:diketogulonate reductase-like aldo/keto reductase
MRSLKLNSGFEMPVVGFGTAGIKDVHTFETAIKLGYRHLDTATFYKNEEFIGEAI